MILVTGGTGLVGRHLLLALSASEISIRATYRSQDKVEEVREWFAFAKANNQFSKIQWVQADITNIPALSEAFIDVTHVYHCAAFISFDPYQFQKLLKTNVEGTANVVNLCLSAKVKKLCYMSSVAVISDKPNTPINEENHWDPNAQNSVYAISKYGAEMEVWRGSQEGLDVLIVNPGVILGEGSYEDGSGSFFKRAWNESGYYPKGSTGFIDVKDVAQAMVTGIKSSIANERFILVTANAPFKEVMVSISKAIDKKPPKRALSKSLLSILVQLDYLKGIFTRKRHLTREGAQALSSNTSYDSAKAQQHLNLEMQPLETTIKRIAAHFTAE